MNLTPDTDEKKAKEVGIIAHAWIDTKNTLLRKNRAGKQFSVYFLIIIGAILFPTVIAFMNYGGFGRLFWEAFLANAAMGLILLLSGVIALFLGLIAKYLRRDLAPNSFQVLSEMEDAFENASEDTEGDATPPMTDEQWERFRKL